MNSNQLNHNIKEDQTISMDSLILLTECIFEHNMRYYDMELQ